MLLENPQLEIRQYMTKFKNIHIFIKKYNLYNMYTQERKKHIYSYQYLCIKHNYKINNYIGIFWNKYLSLYKIVSMILRIVSTLVLNAFVIHVDIFIRFGMLSIAVSCEVSHTILFFNIDGHMYSIPRNIRYMDILYHCSWYLFDSPYWNDVLLSPSRLAHANQQYVRACAQS